MGMMFEEEKKKRELPFEEQIEYENEDDRISAVDKEMRRRTRSRLAEVE